jgi:hypothetical protein
MRTRKIPREFRHSRAYAEIRSYIVDFVAGLYSFCWIVGRPGTSKTELVRAITRGRPVCHLKGGQLTPIQFYKKCYRHLGQPIILDDAESLLRDPLGERLVASLGEVSPTKRMSFVTTSRALEDVPDTYFTTSPLLVIANHITSNEAILESVPKALRGCFGLMSFEPEALAIGYWVGP